MNNFGTRVSSWLHFDQIMMQFIINKMRHIKHLTTICWFITYMYVDFMNNAPKLKIIITKKVRNRMQIFGWKLHFAINTRTQKIKVHSIEPRTDVSHKCYMEGCI